MWGRMSNSGNPNAETRRSKVQILSARNYFSPIDRHCSRNGSGRTHFSILSGRRFEYQNGSWNRRLPPHRVRVQQIEVGFVVKT